jgi:hypothetical protein
VNLRFQQTDLHTRIIIGPAHVHPSALQTGDRSGWGSHGGRQDR